MHIIKSVVKLFYDLLHGLERNNVSLITVIEFAVLLGYDGQLEQNSDMEKELFSSSIDQLKERFSYRNSPYLFILRRPANYRL